MRLRIKLLLLLLLLLLTLKMSFLITEVLDKQLRVKISDNNFE